MTDDKAIVTGNRDGIGVVGLVERALDWFDAEIFHIEHVIVGSDRGVDRDAFRWSLKRERIGTIVSAKWLTGEGPRNAQGPIRNARMPKLFAVKAVLAFPGNAGTANMMSVARREQLPLWICTIVNRNFEWMLG